MALADAQRRSMAALRPLRRWGTRTVDWWERHPLLLFIASAAALVMSALLFLARAALLRRAWRRDAEGAADRLTVSLMAQSRITAILAAQDELLLETNHRLRTPLTIIGAAAVRLRAAVERSDSERVARYLDTIDREVQGVAGALEALAQGPRHRRHGRQTQRQRRTPRHRTEAARLDALSEQEHKEEAG